MVSLSLTKNQRHNNGTKIVFSTNGAGTTGYTHAKKNEPRHRPSHKKETKKEKNKQTNKQKKHTQKKHGTPNNS